MKISIANWVTDATGHVQLQSPQKTPSNITRTSEARGQYIEHPDSEVADEASVLSDLGFARVKLDTTGRQQIFCDDEFAKSVLTFKRPESLVLAGAICNTGAFKSFFAGDWDDRGQFATALLNYLNRQSDASQNDGLTDKELALRFQVEYPAQHRALLEAVFRDCIAASRNFIVVTPTLRHEELVGKMVVDFNDAAIPDPALQLSFNMGASPLTLRKDLQRVMRVRWSDQVANTVRDVAHFFAREVFLQLPGASEDRVSGAIDPMNLQVGLADHIYTVLWASDFRIRLSNSPSFGFNYQAINDLLDAHYESIDRNAIHACAVTFPVITWEKYRQAAASIEQIDGILNEHKGLAPLYFPARFLMSHEVAHTARLYPAPEGLPAVLAGTRTHLCDASSVPEVLIDYFVRTFESELTPIAREALKEKSPRYLTSTLARHFTGTISSIWVGSCTDMAKTLARMFNVCTAQGTLPPYTMVLDRTFSGIALRQTAQMLYEARRDGTSDSDIDRIVSMQADILVKMASTTHECHKRGAKLAPALGRICNLLADDRDASPESLEMAVLGQLDNGYRDRVKRVISTSLGNRLPPLKVRKWIWATTDISPMDDHRYRVVFSAKAADDNEVAPKGRVEIILTRPENLLDDYITARNRKLENLDLTLSVASEDERGRIRLDHDAWMQDCAGSIERLENLLAGGYPLVAINNTSDAAFPAKIEGISAKEHVIASNKIAHFLETHFKEVAERHPVAIGAIFDSEPRGYERLHKRKYNASSLAPDFRRALAACSNKAVRDIIHAARDPMWVSGTGKSFLDMAIELCPAGDGTRSMASYVERAQTFAVVTAALEDAGATEEYFNRSFDAAVESFSSHKLEAVLLRTYMTPEQHDTYKHLTLSLRTPALDRAALGAAMRYEMRRSEKMTLTPVMESPAPERKRLAAII